MYIELEFLEYSFSVFSLSLSLSLSLPRTVRDSKLSIEPVFFFLLFFCLNTCFRTTSFTITVELTGKVLFSAIRPQTLDLSSRFRFHKPFEFPETVEDFALPLNEVDPRVQRGGNAGKPLLD